MRNVMSLGFLLLAAAIFSPVAMAEEMCELPSDIDEGERYLMKFKGESQANRYKILDVDNCWVQLYRSDGNHYWRPINSIIFIGSKEYDE